MKKVRSQQHFEYIALLKQKFVQLSADVIINRLKNFNKSNDISWAYKAILSERGIDDCFISEIREIETD